jgi:hypothetical protein
VSVDPHFERTVLAEFALRERRARLRDRSRGARALAETLHRWRDDLIAHLRRVAFAVPQRSRAVAWLHHGVEARLVARAAIEDRLGERPPDGDSVLALRLLPDPGLAR